MDSAQDIKNRLNQLMQQLDPKSMQRVIRNILAREGRVIRRHAQQALRNDPKNVSHAVKLGQNIRATNDKSGMTVTVGVGAHGTRYMHKNRRGLLKPIAFWLNSGVTGRKTRQSQHRRKNKRGAWGAPHYRAGRYTGKIEGLGFVEKGEATAMPEVYAHIDEWSETVVTRQAQKLGLI